MLGCPKAVVGIGELLDVAAEAVVGELEGVEVLGVVLLEDAERVGQVLSVGAGEEVVEVVLTFRAYLLGVLTQGYKVHTSFSFIL